MSRLRTCVMANQTVTANNGTTHYVWDISGNIIAEANGSTGVTLRETVYLEGMPLAAIDAVAVPKKTYAVHVDHLNRAFGARRSLARRRVMLTDAAKVNVWWASYEPFGKVRATGGTLTQNLGLPGQWFQLESGLAQNWHRHYDATTGRYTTADPLGFVDGPSVFAYAGNAPHRMVDPTGLEPDNKGERNWQRSPGGDDDAYRKAREKFPNDPRKQAKEIEKWMRENKSCKQSRKDQLRGIIKNLKNGTIRPSAPIIVPNDVICLYFPESCGLDPNET